MNDEKHVLLPTVNISTQINILDQLLFRLQGKV